MKRWIIASLALCALYAGTPRENVAAQVVALTTTDLALGADMIVRGTVLSQSTAWTENGAMMETTYTLEVSESLKGNFAPGAQVNVVIPGGTIGSLSIRASESANFAQGEDAVVFGRARAAGGYDTYGCFQGKYTLLSGQVRELLNTSFDTFRQDIINALN